MGSARSSVECWLCVPSVIRSPCLSIPSGSATALAPPKVDRCVDRGKGWDTLGAQVALGLAGVSAPTARVVPQIS
eukprot:scaffold12829_cov116-Isochrysis_galbana.AAC.11